MHSYTDHSTVFGRRRLGSLITDPKYVTAYHPKQFKTLLERTMKAFSHWLTTGNMPRISRDMQGDREVWKVYDPISLQTRYFDEENALRAWMEQRYYQ